MRVETRRVFRWWDWAVYAVLTALVVVVGWNVLLAWRHDSIWADRWWVGVLLSAFVLISLGM